MKLRLATYLFSIFLLSGCALQQVYYVSPFNGNNTSYHAIPLKSDSTKSSNYISGSLYFGTANAHYSDDVFSFESNIYHCNQFGVFQSYYGIDASLGNYHVGTLTGAYYGQTVEYINPKAGNKFFGGIGIQGGMNFVLPLSHGEWRLMGIEMSSHMEYGSYLKFRKEIPDHLATLNIPSNTFSTIGLYSELVIKVKHGCSL